METINKAKQAKQTMIYNDSDRVIRKAFAKQATKAQAPTLSSAAIVTPEIIKQAIAQGVSIDAILKGRA
jgi:hypothetical protein